MVKRFQPHRLVIALLIAVTLSTWARCKTPPPAKLSAQETRQAFLKIIDRPRVELAPKVEEQDPDGGILHFHFSFASEADQRVPGILLIKKELMSDGVRHPAVVVLHGTGGKKEKELGILKKLAEQGFVAVAIDGRFHGERGTYADYNAAIAKAFADGNSHPLYYDTVWDILRLIDYLQSRPDVDGKRIGLIGYSKGGIETYLAAAVDPRIAVAVPCIALQSFRWGMANDGWHARIGTVRKGFDAAAKSAGVGNPGAEFVKVFYDHLLPGIYDEFDGPAMVPLIAPRPLLGISGDRDPNNPLPGIRLCEEAAKAAYEKAGAPEKFELLLEQDTGHAVKPETEAVAIKWFNHWLRNEGSSGSR
jgi:fermentation-respiration switch protein FrsA (DUF1100 family)